MKDQKTTKNGPMGYNYLKVNRCLRKLYGNDIASLIASLVEHIQNVTEKGEKGLLKGEFYESSGVYINREKMAEKESLNLSSFDRRLAILVEDFDLFIKELRGTPPKIYLFVNYEIYDKLINGELVIYKHLTEYQKRMQGLSVKKNKWQNAQAGITTLSES